MAILQLVEVVDHRKDLMKLLLPQRMHLLDQLLVIALLHADVGDLVGALSARVAFGVLDAVAVDLLVLRYLCAGLLSWRSDDVSN